MQKLLKWKENPSKKPLVIQGARQVGKTWLLKEFGKNYLYNECKKLENEEYINNTNKENNIQREKDKKNFEKNEWVVCYRKSNGPWKYRGIPVYIQGFYSDISEANDNKYMYNRRSSNKVYYLCNVSKLKVNEI